MRALRRAGGRTGRCLAMRMAVEAAAAAAAASAEARRAAAARHAAATWAGRRTTEVISTIPGLNRVILTMNKYNSL